VTLTTLRRQRRELSAAALHAEQLCVHLAAGSELECAAWIGLPDALLTRWAKLPIGAEGGPAGQAAATGRAVIAENAHVRLAAPENNDGAQILRRAYSYDNGVARIAERWPPWRQGTTFDAGLLFVCYQRDPRTGFSKIFENMSRVDMLNQFTTHVGSGLFACPPGARAGEYIGQRLFETA